MSATMSAKFECDKCHTIFDPEHKRATLELTERDADHLPHKYFKRKLELCDRCFEQLRGYFQSILQLPAHSSTRPPPSR